jgi:FAD synthase
VGGAFVSAHRSGLFRHVRAAVAVGVFDGLHLGHRDILDVRERAPEPVARW